MPLFRTRLRVRRAELEWSQARLAAQVGVTRQTINAIERGRFHSNLRLAFKFIYEDIWRSSALDSIVVNNANPR